MVYRLRSPSGFAEDVIVEILKDQDLGFGDIKSLLAHRGIKYKTNRGQVLALNRLGERVTKIKSPGIHPVYHYNDKFGSDAAIFVKHFRYLSGEEIVKRANDFLLDEKITLGSFIEKFANLIGIYVLFVILNDEKLFHIKNMADLYKMRRNIWAKNLLPVEDIFLAMSNAIRHFDQVKQDKTLKSKGTLRFNNSTIEQFRRQLVRLHKAEINSMKQIRVESLKKSKIKSKKQ